MASPGVWSKTSSSIPIGPIKVTERPMYNSDWKKINVNSVNYAVRNLEMRITGTGAVEYRYPTTSDPNGPKTTATSIQEIADDRLYVANFGYSTDTTEAIKIASQSYLQTTAEERGIVTTGTQPTPQDRPQGTSNSPQGTSDGSEQAPNVSTFSSSAEKFNKGGKYNSNFLIYPRDINDEQDRIVFVQHYYKSAIGDNSTIDIGVNTFTRERYSTIAEKDLLGTAVLPMPNDISETNVTAWGEDSLSTLAAMVGSAALAGTGNLASGNFGGTLQEARQLLGDVFGNQPGAKEAIEQFLNLNAAASVVKMAGINFNPEAFRARITGTAINPNMELLFQGPKLRSFGFQFKMTPRNALEARNIRYILKFFKKGMAPKRAEEQPFFLGAPNVFDIHFRSGKNDSTDYNKDLKSIGRIKTCALQQCVVNYTPDGFYAAYMDSAAGGSQPISVQLQMTFTELTPIYNDNYDESNYDNVGWDKLDFEYTQSSNNQ